MSPSAARSASSLSASPASFAAPRLTAAVADGHASPSFNSVATGDFNSDGILDVAAVGLNCASGLGNKVAVFLGKGDGSFQPPASVPAGDCLGGVAAVRLRGQNAPFDLI